MPKRTHAYLPATQAAVATLGAQIAAGRRELGWTAAELAERLGVQPALVARIEKGSEGTAIGTYLEAAVLCQVPLFGAEVAQLGELAERERNRLALLSRRVRRRGLEVDSDF